jgi:acetyl esterase/lipase
MVKRGPAVDTQDVVVPGRDGPIPARFYTRPGTRPGAPAFLFIHGGGFIDCGVDFCDNVQRGLAHRTGYVVVGLSYRLAPEHPFPACTTARTCCSGCTTPARAAWTRSASPSAARAPGAT